MQAVNAARAQARTCGTTEYAAAPALAWNDKLFSAAAGHSQDMATNNYFSHTSLDGTTFGQRISATGYGWYFVAENIAKGQPTVAAVMDSWMKSAGHCANIMNKSVADVGVACVKSSSSSGYYWTMNLGRPR
ncbi:MAG TPA: CAP domain-containing protein [Burkholderiaceae bacterium]|nr:CAP domain-containing protein [Burkholderiaceae bacterium]